MAFAATASVKPMSIVAYGCQISEPSPFRGSNTSHQQIFFSIPVKPVKFQLLCSYSSSLSLPSFFMKKNEPMWGVAVIAAQKQDNNPVLLEEQEFGGSFTRDASENEFEGQEGDELEEDSRVSNEYSEQREEAQVFVGNLPYDVDSEKLAKFFEEAGVVDISQVIYNRETGQSRGFGFVTMSTAEEADKAVKLFHRYDMNGRFLIVNKASPKGSRIERPPRVFESSKTIYVGNLPWGMDNEGLEQLFRAHGKVVFARVIVDRDTGRSRGFGFVEMASDSEANDAIANLDGQNLDGRALRVSKAEERRRSF